MQCSGIPMFPADSQVTPERVVPCHVWERTSHSLSQAQLCFPVWVVRASGLSGTRKESYAAGCMGKKRAGRPFAGDVALVNSAYHRITECSGLEVTSVGHPVQPPCRSRVTYSRLHRNSSRRGLNISREGDSTTSPGNLFQGSVTLRGKKFFLMFRRNFLCFSLCPLPLVLSLGSTEKSLAPSS